MFHDAGHLAALVVAQILTLAGLAAVTIPAGRLILGPLATVSPEEDLALSASAGLGLFGTALALAGFCGELRRTAVVAIALALFLGGLAGRRRAGRAPDREFRSTLALISLPLAAIFVLGLAPPHAFDETLYHLPAARAFAESHHLPFLPQLRFPVFPQLCEVIFAGVLLASGSSATHTLGLYATAVICLALAAWGRRLGAAGTGRLAAAAWLGCPLAVGLASESYVDLELTMFLLVALLAWEIGETTGDRRWRTRAALLAGFACGTKYLGLPILGGMIVLALVDAARRRTASSLGSIITASAAGGGLWYSRSFIFTGSPVFPFLAPIVGSSPWLTDFEAGGSSVVGRGLLDVWGACRRLFGMMLPTGAHPLPAFSPAMLAAAALGILALRSARGRRLMGAAAVLFVLTRATDDRYLLPFFAIVLAASMDVATHLERRVSRVALAALCALLLLPGSAGLAVSLVRLRSIPATPPARAEYLDRWLRGARAIDSLNARFGSNYRVLVWSGENLRDLARGEIFGDWFGLHSYRGFSKSMADGQTLWTALRDERIEWFLYDRKRHPLARPRDPSFDRLFRLDFDDGSVELFQTVTRDP